MPIFFLVLFVYIRSLQSNEISLRSPLEPHRRSQHGGQSSLIYIYIYIIINFHRTIFGVDIIIIIIELIERGLPLTRATHIVYLLFRCFFFYFFFFRC